MIIIAMGYILFAMYATIACCLSCLCCVIVCFRGEGAVNTQEMVARIPYANAISSLNKKAFSNIQNKNMSECVICMMDFKEEDEIAELKCDERHYFHAACLEDWLKRKLECPLCKKPVQP